MFVSTKPTHIDRGMIADERDDPVLRRPRGRQIVKHDGELVLIKRLVHVGDIAVDHVEQAVVFHDHDVVAVGVALGLDHADAGGDDLGLREIVVGAVGEGHGDDVLDAL